MIHSPKIVSEKVEDDNIVGISPQMFEQLFMEYYPRLVRFSVRFVDEETAEDIVQNCFMRLWEKRTKTPAINLQGLLFQMVRNECLNVLKHRTITSTESLDSLMETQGSEQLYWQDFAPDADAVLLGKELERQINEALTQVSDKSREIFMLSRHGELKPKEIAEKLGISRQAVEKHIAVALTALKKYLPKDLLWVAILYSILLYQ